MRQVWQVIIRAINHFMIVVKAHDTEMNSCLVLMMGFGEISRFWGTRCSYYSHLLIYSQYDTISWKAVKSGRGYLLGESRSLDIPQKDMHSPSFLPFLPVRREVIGLLDTPTTIYFYYLSPN